MLTLDQLGEFVAKHHTRDLFRLETLPFYNAVSDDDDLGRYLRGEPAPTAEAKQPWLDRIRADVAAGRVWRRIHAVTHPLPELPPRHSHAITPCHGVDPTRSRTAR